MPDPLWLRLRNHPSLFCLHMHPEQAAALLDAVGQAIYETDHRDSGSILTWLEAEAEKARTAAKTLETHEKTITEGAAALRPHFK